MAGLGIRRRGLDLLVQPDRVEASLWRNYAGDRSPRSRQRLFDHYQHIARDIAARQFYKRKVGSCELGDVEQLAYEGLLHAIGRFDPTRGVPFSAFCRPRIAGNISTGLESGSENSAQSTYRRRLERDRLKSLKTDPEQIDDPVAALAQLTTLLAIGLMAEESTPLDPDMTPSAEPSAYESLAWREMQRNLNKTIEQLDDPADYVITQHYVRGVSFKQIAEIIGVTRGRVSQIHRAALLKLRDLMGRYR